MRHRILLSVVMLLTTVYVASSFVVGQGCIVTIDLSRCRQTNTVEYVLPGTSLAIWRSNPHAIENPLLDLLADRYGEANAISSRVEIARFNAQWRDGHTMAYYPLVRNRDEWVGWTNDNANLADYIWPRFLRYLADGDTSRAYMLLWHAKQYETVPQIQDAIDADPDMRSGG
ncbi:hypothetical protein Poly21_22220 [Allorhodopirellula heiligendammensis]|uniref:Uncharacterized protein n=2 Tax=Allorhodopirellula heiligendammensis TaxID=2714739 RepID=A0A5C6C7D5_9BACT|nr:hypothetical protein Poly21_22220 [Allorhodopirellula heiligendammensis]